MQTTSHRTNVQSSTFDPQMRENFTMKTTLGMIATLIAAGTLTGCGTSSRTDTTDVDDAIITVTPDSPPPALDVHDHPSHGPHGGELIEIGKASFHGELLHDENQVTIYVLDANAKESVAIDSPQLTVSIKHNGQVQSHELAANPEKTDPADKSSRFTSQDKQLAKSLTDDAEGVVIFQFDGKSYTGSISHDHADHSDHDHADHSDHDH